MKSSFQFPWVIIIVSILTILWIIMKIFGVIKLNAENLKNRIVSKLPKRFFLFSVSSTDS